MLMIPSLLFVSPSLVAVVAQRSSVRCPAAKKTKTKHTMQSKYIKNSNRMLLILKQDTPFLEVRGIDLYKHAHACSYTLALFRLSSYLNYRTD